MEVSSNGIIRSWNKLRVHHPQCNKFGRSRLSKVVLFHNKIRQVKPGRTQSLLGINMASCMDIGQVRIEGYAFLYSSFRSTLQSKLEQQELQFVQASKFSFIMCVLKSPELLPVSCFFHVFDSKFVLNFFIAKQQGSRF